MGRLTKWTRDGNVEFVITDRNRIYKAFEKLAHYEDLEEAGRLIEVVRCKDCAKCQEDIFKDILWCDGRMVEPNHYCSYAKLKELEGENEKY